MFTLVDHYLFKSKIKKSIAKEYATKIIALPEFVIIDESVVVVPEKSGSDADVVKEFIEVFVSAKNQKYNLNLLQR